MRRSRYRFAVALGVFATMMALLAGATAAAPPAQATPPHSTTRTFLLRAGQAERRFLLRERSGVILLSRLTVPVGVRAYVDATIPHLAGTRFSTPRPNDPALKCTRNGTSLICTQGQEWCPMPAAVWHLHLVKKGGPAGPIRIDYVVGPPPPNA